MKIHVLAAGLSLAQSAWANDFIAPTRDIEFLTAVIQAERPEFTPPTGVTGITVPHHLLAADLIARGFWAASAGEYDRVLLLGPDHFRAVEGAFATTTTPHETVFGTVSPALGPIRDLLRHDLFVAHPTPMDEHATMALMPFIARFFPDADVIPVYASIFSGQADWDAAIDVLAPLVTPRTLIIQSTDYSHYRSRAQAVRLDQETLAMIAAARADLVPALRQPDHMDARAAQYLQMHLQRRVFGAHAAVIANRNSVDYGGWSDATTSYIVSVHHRDPAQLSGLAYDDQARFFLAGDVLLGRFLEPALTHPNSLAAILQAVATVTRGAPILANLEGVLFAETPANAPTGAHVMALELAAPILRNLGITAVSLANNHAWDFGKTGFEGSVTALHSIGVTPVAHRQIIDIGPARILALNALPGRDPYLDPHDDLEWLCNATAAPPLIAMIHWGAEYTDQPQDAQTELATRLSDCGISAIIGGHSHLASDHIEITNGRTPWVFSVGNFLFDQSAERASGALVELRIFEQGTVAMRLLPLANLFDLGRGAFND